MDIRPAWFMWATRRDLTAQSCPVTEWSCMAPAITIRRISALPSEFLHPIPMASAPLSHGARPPDGPWDSAWAWQSDPGAAPGGARSAIGDGAGELLPGDGADGVVQPRPMSTGAGAIRRTPEPGLHGRIPGRVMSARAHAAPITT